MGGELYKDFANYVHGSTASSFYQDYANRLQDVATGGNNTALRAGDQAIRSGESIGNNITNAGAARASGIIGSTNSFTNLLGELAGGYGQGLFSSGGSGGAVGPYAGRRT